MPLTRPLIAVSIIALLAACATGSRTTSSAAPAAEPAREATEAPLPRNVSVPEYMDFLDKLRVAVKDDVPREFTDMELEKLNAIDRKLRENLTGVETVAALETEQQIQVLELHEELEAVVVGNDSNQIVCRREHQVGRIRKQTRCRTRAQLREDARNARAFLDNQRRATMLPPSGAQ